MRHFPCVALALMGTVPIVNAQNLVADGGLEDTLKCPQFIGAFHHPTNTNNQYIAQWRATTLASPDLHHTCGYNDFQPRTGDGYAGIIFYDPTGYREYITALLAQPMEPGQCYYVEFWVALSTGSIMAIDEVQVHFSNGVPLDLTFPPPGPLPLTPHLQPMSAPTSNNYQQVCGFYTASGGENAMTFGNFQDNAGTTLTQVGSVGGVQAYYYIDDVRVSPLELGPDPVVCGDDTAMLVSNIQCPQLNLHLEHGRHRLRYADHGEWTGIVDRVGQWHLCRERQRAGDRAPGCRRRDRRQRHPLHQWGRHRPVHPARRHSRSGRYLDRPGPAGVQWPGGPGHGDQRQLHLRGARRCRLPERHRHVGPVL